MPDLCTIPPDFTLPIYGSPGSFTLSSHTGDAILLSFMNLACGHCWGWWERWNALHSDYTAAGNVEIVVVMFNGDPADVTDAMVDDELASRGKLPPSFTLLKDAGNWGDVAPTWLAGFTGSVWLPYCYLISPPHLIVDKWHWHSTANGDLLSFDSSDDNDVENFIRHRIDDLLTDRPRWNTILTLDYSGSMSDNVTVHGVTKPKIEFLKDAVDSWLRVWKDYALCGDKLGVVQFQSNASTDGLLQPILPGATVEAVLAMLDAAATGGCTAMGAGIATGIDLLETEAIVPGDPHQRYMVVFTDGIQNRNPMAIVTADCGGGGCVWEPQIRQISVDEADFYGWNFCGSDDGLSDYAGPLPRILHDNPMQTAIHTIGIGPPDSYAGLLNVISDETSGVAYVDSDVWPNLEEFFLESLVENFRGSSLAVVAKATATLADNETEVLHTFSLNRSVRKATILLSWLDESVPLTMDVYKDGEKLNLANKLTTKPLKQMATLPFPLYQPARSHLISLHTANPITIFKAAGRSNAGMGAVSPAMWQLAPSHEVDAEGEFQIVVKRLFSGPSGNVPYNLTVLADDSCTEVELHLPRQQYYTGELIPLDILVTEGNQPLQDVFSASVDIRRPVNAFGNLVVKHLRDAKLGKQKVAKDSLQGPYQAAVKTLMADAKAAAKMRAYEVDRLALQPDYRMGAHGKVGQKGVFRTRYATTQVAGHYRIQARVRAVSASCGVFERLVTKTVLVLPRPSLDHSAVKISFAAKRDQLTIQMSPADQYGNLLGPGFAHHMVFALDDEPSGHVKDNMDGSYEIKLKCKKGDKRLASLWIAGERLIREPVEKLALRKKE
jgi:hypothetical protein